MYAKIILIPNPIKCVYHLVVNLWKTCFVAMSLGYNFLNWQYYLNWKYIDSFLIIVSTTIYHLAEIINICNLPYSNHSFHKVIRYVKKYKDSLISHDFTSVLKSFAFQSNNWYWHNCKWNSIRCSALLFLWYKPVQKYSIHWFLDIYRYYLWSFLLWTLCIWYSLFTFKIFPIEIFDLHSYSRTKTTYMSWNIPKFKCLKRPKVIYLKWINPFSYLCVFVRTIELRSLLKWNW